MIRGDFFLYKINTRNNVQFERPLNELLTIRITEDEQIQLVTISKNNDISISELVRNIVRDHIATYAVSKNLRKKLLVSNKIKSFLLEKRLVLTRDDTSLAQIREILTDFEAVLEAHPKRIDIVSVLEYKEELDKLLEIIYKEDEWLSKQIDSQVKRIMKSKHFKGLIYNP